MRALDAGNSFVVTSNSRPVGELRPLKRSRFVHRQDLIEAFRNAPSIDATQFRSDIDCHIDQEIDPRD